MIVKGLDHVQLAMPREGEEAARRFYGRVDISGEWDFCPLMSVRDETAEIEITPAMVEAAEAVIEDYLRYSTTAAAIDVEVVLRAAFRARSDASRNVKDAAKV